MNRLHFTQETELSELMTHNVCWCDGTIKYSVLSLTDVLDGYKDIPEVNNIKKAISNATDFDSLDMSVESLNTLNREYNHSCRVFINEAEAVETFCQLQPMFKPNPQQSQEVVVNAHIDYLQQQINKDYQSIEFNSLIETMTNSQLIYVISTLLNDKQKLKMKELRALFQKVEKLDLDLYQSAIFLKKVNDSKSLFSTKQFNQKKAA